MIKPILFFIIIFLVLCSCEHPSDKLPKTGNDSCGTCRMTVITPKTKFGHAYGDLVIVVKNAKNGNEISKSVITDDNGSNREIEIPCGQKLLVQVSAIHSCSGPIGFGGLITIISGERYISPQSCDITVSLPYVIIHSDC